MKFDVNLLNAIFFTFIVGLTWATSSDFGSFHDFVYIVVE